MNTDQTVISQIRTSEKAMWMSFTVALDEETSLQVMIDQTTKDQTKYTAKVEFTIKRFFALFSDIFKDTDISEIQELIEQYLDQIMLSICVTPDVSKRFECASVINGKEIKLIVESAKEKQLYIGLNLGIYLSANDIPLLGKYLPAEFVFGIEGFSSSEKGFVINANLGGNPISFPLNKPVEQKPATRETKPVAAVPTAAAATTNQQKENTQKDPAFQLKIVSVGFKDGALAIKLDASFCIWLLRFDVIGLQVAFKLEFPPKPAFQFDGIGLSFRKPPIELTGMFYKNTNPAYTDYVGFAIIKTESFSISAVGGYSPEESSVFLYGVLNYPLGGIPAFFIVGLALGFGVNRKLMIPAITEISTFPLVALAMSDSRKASDSTALIKSISAYIPPEKGNYWLAVGIKFTSFEKIKGFALLVLTFGEQLKVALLGLARISMPDKNPMVIVELALRAEIDFNAGTIQIEAQVTAASFLLDPDCHITGGFAYYMWLKGEYQGDFVLSIGGYHPRFLVPSHYPKVPRVGMNWVKKMGSSKLIFKGQTYFTLTPNCVMAGADIEVDFVMGSITACFKAGVHVLISWMPYHYDLEAYIKIHVCYHFRLRTIFGTISKDIKGSFEAGLMIWGPSFGGKAHIKIIFISFDIEFGDKPRIPPATPADFRKKYLPATTFCSTSLTSGMIKEWEETGIRKWWVDPLLMEIKVESAIPIKNCLNLPDLISNKEFGIAPADIKYNEFETSIKVSVKLNETLIPVDIFPIFNNTPKALWGVFVERPKISSDSPIIKDVLTGLIIKPQQSIGKQNNNPILSPDIAYDLTENTNAIFYTKETGFSEDETLKDELALIMNF